MHFRDVERFLSGHHLTVSVRSEDELDISMILDKVSKVSATSYNFKEKPQGESLESALYGLHYIGGYCGVQVWSTARLLLGQLTRR